MSNSGKLELLSLAGIISRARGFRLYTEDGRRLVDLWQDDGRAVLGHKPSNVLKELKNTAERGLFAPYPTRAESRFFKCIKTLFPNARNVFFADARSLQTAAGAQSIPVWRPFSQSGHSVSLEPFFAPVLPWSLAPAILVQTDSEPLVQYETPAQNPQSPALLAAGTRAVYNLIADGGKRENLKYRRLNAVLQKTSLRRDGIYLYFDGAGELWPSIFEGFLQKGFLAPPSPGSPVILPAELSAGEEAALAGLFRNFFGL
ncbi:MAG: hypothetical protein LBC53_03400 [Spirochaetaceae bacterium]|jgi:hypothetical protein|nr:hypothetical protein [Spirochaetaceae bacterium]